MRRATGAAKKTRRRAGPRRLGRRELLEEHETLSAIRAGEADAVVIAGADGEKVYTLKDSDFAYRIMVEQMSEGAATATPDGLILYSNPRFAAMLGLSLERVIGASLHQFIPERSREEVRRLFAQAADGVARAEIELVRDSGRSLPLQLSVATLSKPGEPALSIVATDLSQEKERQAFSDELERRVEERTAELNDLNSELDAFNYSVSHDLRAPLRRISAFAELLTSKSPQLDESGRDFCARIRGNVERMSEIIDAMLLLARASRAERRLEPLDLTAMAREIAEELEAAEPGRRVAFKVEPGLRAEGDPSLVRLALQNLLSNAWKFTGREARPSVELGRLPGDGETVFYVRDNGVGFEPEYKGKMFEPFQRLHGASDFPGSGIGLTIVQRVVRRHGGRVWAEGAPDRGAVVYFSLGGGPARPRT